MRMWCGIEGEPLYGYNPILRDVESAREAREWRIGRVRMRLLQSPCSRLSWLA
jgi:hypothetical protein